MTNFFLQDSRGLVGENLMWWATDGNGYTSDVRKAQVYSETDAQAQHNCRQSDVPWPADYITERMYLAVDMQYLGKPLPATGECYAQVPGRWSGNDCFWLTCDSNATTDLRRAATFTTAQPGFVLWPKGHIDSLSRPAVRAADVTLREAIAATGITVQKPKKVRQERVRCCQCNRFLSKEQLWSGECPNCGTDNRP